MQCIYTKKLLMPKEYDLDHFIPWSFVVHDQIWNLLPADSSISSSKSNKLPDLDIYLAKLAKEQQKAVSIIYNMKLQVKVCSTATCTLFLATRVMWKIQKVEYVELFLGSRSIE